MMTKLHDIGSGFNSSTLVEARINYGDEIANKSLKNAANIKAVVSKTRQHSQQKFRKNSAPKTHAKLFFSANNVSQLARTIDDPALFDRIMFLPFYNPVSSENRVLDLDEIIFNQEAEEILSLLIDSLTELCHNKMVFDISEDSLLAHKIFYNSQNNLINDQQVECFLQDKCYFGSSERINKEFLYRAYCQWHKESNKQDEQLTNKDFFSQLNNIPGVYAIDRFRGVNPETGLRIKNPQSGVGGIALK